MPAKNLQRVDSERVYLHIFNKGLDNKVIFNDEADYETFLGFINEYLSEPVNPKANQKSFTIKGKLYKGTPHQPKNYFKELEVISYCIRPTYFSIIVHQIKAGSLEKFIRSLCTRYSIYFNKKYRRTGSLFQGPYKSLQINDISLLVLLSCYFHKANTHSSFAEYVGNRDTKWINRSVVLYPMGNKNYAEFVKNYHFTQNSKDKISALNFGKFDDELERRDVVIEEKPESTVLASIKPIEEQEENVYRVREYIGATFIFLILVGIGLFNINFTAQAQKSLDLDKVAAPVQELITEVLSEQTKSSPEPSLIPLSSPEASPLTTPNPAGGDESEATDVGELSSAFPQIGLLVTIGNTGGNTINIRKDATENAEIIGLALEGEMYEVLQIKTGWAEIKLIDGKGFIPQRYLKVE